MPMFGVHAISGIQKMPPSMWSAISTHGIILAPALQTEWLRDSLRKVLRESLGTFFYSLDPLKHFDPMILFRGGIFNIPCEFVREFWSSPELLSGFRDKGTTWRLPCSVKAFGVIYFKAAAFTTWLALMSGASLSLLLVSLLATAFLPFRDDWFVFGVQ